VQSRMAQQRTILLVPTSDPSPETGDA
jgi:hypothetical protein